MISFSAVFNIYNKNTMKNILDVEKSNRWGRMGRRRRTEDVCRLSTATSSVSQ